MGKATDGRSARRGRGFTRAGGLVQGQIRQAGERRGFSETRLVLRWGEIVGADIAAICRPVRVSWGRGGLGATLILLCRGGAGPILQARLPVILERVNDCFGTKISRIRITQTAAAGHGGFAASPAPCSAGPTAGSEAPEPGRAAALACTSGIADPGLRTALAALGSRILSHPTTRNTS